MLDPAILLFREVYQQTSGSVEAAILELKRNGWTQVETVCVVVELFDVPIMYAERVVATSVAWE